jgi:alpha-mannosidase
VTWRDYFEHIAIQRPQAEWHFSQEDVQVSLVWGAQVLQRIAQQVRGAENRIVMAEKLEAMAAVYRGTLWPGKTFDEAWRTLLLSQHHDCWIVPYNGRRGDTWADKVGRWTGATKQVSNKIMQEATGAFAANSGSNGPVLIRVFNTLAAGRTELASVSLPFDWGEAEARVIDAHGKPVLSQLSNSNSAGLRTLLFQARVPAFGFASYRIEKASPSAVRGVSAALEPDGNCRLENGLYRLVLDRKSGGAVKSLIARKMRRREFVQQSSARRFNELRGYFFQLGKFSSTADQPATFRIIEDGPLRARVEIHGQLAGHPVTQIITLVEDEPRIDFQLKIDWQGNQGIGSDFEQVSGFAAEHNQKAFYDDRYKLLALFPLNLAGQRVFKDAPFDVTESRLTNTFFSTWNELKNNVILHWVDVEDAPKRLGLALMTDHTTSYAHGAEHPLGLTVQYSGVGLWGRNYSLNGPTELNYAVVPHAGTWEDAEIERNNARWNEPLPAVSTTTRG